ncbi:RNA methyltransferase [Barnesiella sp. An55]|uniref:RNA methyltransferase n=1 Tax=Barnesiella sp. An55 TaxID=1965646 RepID=UPI000B382DB3|nr:RNA methyltransferase [Barnesiella sp. An55]OUN71130.1 RNA methyltransferase [Barnesiella sp. An55]HIZ26123.1 RNA methyltransferase [Candidatus Barnesiella merdipullorum]
MLSKNQIKRIQSLARKKGRRDEGCFIAEGNKLVEDTWEAFECDLLLATRRWIESHPQACYRQVQEVTDQEMAKVSQLTTPADVMAIYRIPRYRLDVEALRHELVLALDTVQDPGNLGTIVRLADWFGIRHIVCSPETADLYNPKVVQATMGALARVRLYYTPLAQFLEAMDRNTVYGTFLDGTDIYRSALSSHGVIVMGNEGNGISPELEPYIGSRLYIPSYPAGQPTSESLNVAVAAAITCAEFRRRQIVS